MFKNVECSEQIVKTVASIVSAMYCHNPKIFPCTEQLSPQFTMHSKHARVSSASFQRSSRLPEQPSSRQPTSIEDPSRPFGKRYPPTRAQLCAPSTQAQSARNTTTTTRHNTQDICHLYCCEACI